MSIPIGRAVVYYTGELARDRLTARLATADAAWEAALRGEVDLLQRRRPDGQLEYVAIRRRAIDRSPVKPATITQSIKRAA